MLSFSDVVWLMPVIYIVIFVIGLMIGKSKPIIMMSSSIILAFFAFVIASGVMWERTTTEVLDYSFYLDWFVIGESTYRIGYELNNSSTWFLLIISLVLLLVLWLLFYKNEKDVISSVYGYLGLLAFASTGIVLADNMILFLCCAQLLSYSVYLILSQLALGYPYKAIFRFITSQLMGYAFLFIALAGLYWYMPKHSIQFTMLETVFNGPALEFTERMKNIIAGAIVVSALFFSGIFPYGNWMKHVSIERPILRVALYCYGNALLPVVLLLKYYTMISEVADILVMCQWLGTLVVIWFTIRMLINSKQSASYIGMMMLGMLLFAFGFKAIMFVHIQFAIVMFSLVVIYGAALHTKSIIVYGAFLIGMLTLIGVPPLSGYWIQQSLINTIVEHYSLFWYVISLLLTLCFSLSMTIHFTNYMKQSHEQRNRKGIVFVIIWPAILLIVLGLYWIVNSKQLETWLFDSVWMQSMNISSMIFTMVSVAVGVAAAWLFSERITEALSTTLDKTDFKLKYYGEKLAKTIGKLGHFIVVGIQALERLLVNILTVWLPYPIRYVTRMGSELNLFKSVGLVLIITVTITVIWIGAKGG